VDDEPQLSEIVSEMLGRLGYEVTAYRNALDALACFTEHPDRFDLIITDMTMPKMTGAELAAKIRAIRADLSILICTGYDAGFAAEETCQLDIHDVLTKPLSMTTLAVNVRQALDNPPG
jgi:CheY-like chemotaxis protein